MCLPRKIKYVAELTCLCIRVKQRHEGHFEGFPGSNKAATSQYALLLCEGLRRVLCKRWSGTLSRPPLGSFMISVLVLLDVIGLML